MNVLGEYSRRVPKRLSRAARGLQPLSAKQEVVVGKLVSTQLGRDAYLLHGTTLGSRIFRTDTILHAEWGNEAVSLTRDAITAVHFADNAKDFHDTFGTILILDRSRLKQRYPVDLFCDQDWRRPDQAGKFEMEERIVLRDVAPRYAAIGPQWSIYSSSIGSLHSLSFKPEVFHTRKGISSPSFCSRFGRVVRSNLQHSHPQYSTGFTKYKLSGGKKRAPSSSYNIQTHARVTHMTPSAIRARSQVNASETILMILFKFLVAEEGFEPPTQGL
jgi:hypothetical protein